MEQLKEQLSAIRQEMTVNILNRARRSIEICKESMNTLQDHVLQHGFTDLEEEIFFFKNIKPAFFSRLILHHEIYKLEIGRPLGGVSDQKNYLQKEFVHIRSFYDDNKFWYQYYRAGETYLDEKLFQRGNQNTPLSWRLYDINMYSAFTTNCDYIFSRIIANEWLVDYLQNSIISLNEENTSHSKTNEQPKLKPLIWTDSKVGLTELCYAFKAKGVFNNGNATLKEITDYVQQIFSIELSQPPRMLQEILRRKTGYATYHDMLKDAYLKYIDAIEDKNIK